MTLVLGRLYQQATREVCKTGHGKTTGEVSQGPMKWNKGVTQRKLFQVMEKETKWPKKKKIREKTSPVHSIIFSNKTRYFCIGFKDPKIIWISCSWEQTDKGKRCDFKGEKQGINKDQNFERPLCGLFSSWKIHTSIEIYFQRPKANNVWERNNGK